MPTQLHDTTFPTATDKDLQTQLCMLTEKFNRLYPEISYRQMNIGTPAPQEGDVPDVPPPANITEIDDLWGEPVPTGQLPGLDWENPHTGPLDATEGDKRLPGIDIHVHINQNPSEKALSKFGIDEKRLVIITFLRVLVEDAGITIAHGDRFFWKHYVFEAKKWLREGYWKNTSYHMYYEVAAKYTRYGS